MLPVEPPKPTSRFFEPEIRKAIVISCEHYSINSYLNLRREQPEVVDISNVKEDTDRMIDILKLLGFEVNELISPNTEQVGELLQSTIQDQFATSTNGKKTTFWIYFAGLGFFDYGDAAMKVHLDDESPVPLEMMLRYLS